MFGKRAKQSDGKTTQMTVTLPNGLAGIIKTMSAASDQDESKLVEQLLVEALIHVRGKKELHGIPLSTPLTRLANAILCHTIDGGADSVRIVPTQKGLIFRHRRNGEPILVEEGFSSSPLNDLQDHIRQPLYSRFEHMAGLPGGEYIWHPTAQETGVIPITHNGKSFDITVRFIVGEPDAIGEAIELTVTGPLEDRQTSLCL